MLTIKRNKYGINIQEAYFHAAGYPAGRCDLRVDFCVPQPGKHCSQAVTSLIDLKADDETILQGFRKSYRREVRASEGEGEFVTTFIRDPRPQDIHGFCAAYDQFALQRKLPPCNLGKLLFFAGQGSLMLSSIRCVHSGHVLCQHAFIGDGERARLLYSLSSFRLYRFNASQRNRIGRAHRLLHWVDIGYFKRMDYAWYDLGGISHGDPQLESINYFKRGFGGEIREEFVNFTPMSLRGWLAMQYLKRKL